ncbi:MAG: sigma-E processing peptidase SpoIIGA [Firmicutes bacterium]|nr:sigma-E processing peptidase SpoIIGA [Bacillota bacterium]
MYLDLLIFTNLCMDYCLLYAVGRLTHRRSGVGKLLLGALGGVLPAVCFTIFPVSNILWIIFVMITPFFMVGLAYFPLKVRDYIFMGSLMFLLAFVFCGCILVLLNLQPVAMAVDKPVFLLHLLMIGFLFTGVLSFFQPFLEGRKWQALMHARVQVYMDDRKQTIAAYLDTGNRVREPFSRKPVIIVNHQSLQKIIPGDIYKLFKSDFDSVKVMESISDPSLSLRFYLIPVTGLGGRTELLLGFRPDRIKITRGGESREIGSQVAIGIHKHNFNNSGEYEALIPPEVLQLVS